MRLFHLSDLHIGMKLMNYDLKEDQRHVFKQILQYAKQYQPDVVMISGDIYDKPIPSIDAIQMFDWLIEQFQIVCENVHILIISGNHDSATRLETFHSILQKQNIYIVGHYLNSIQKVTLNDAFGPIHFYLLPFVKPSMLKTKFEESPSSYDDMLHKIIDNENIDVSYRNILLSHQFYLPKGVAAETIERADSEIRTVGNIDEICSDVLTNFDYAALGHIHKPMKVGMNQFRYCGSPMPYSLSEANQQKHILMIDLLEKGSCNIQELFLTPLRAIYRLEGTLEDVLDQASDDYVSIVLTESVNRDDIQRIYRAFPHVLEIRKKNGTTTRTTNVQNITDIDPLTLCQHFLVNFDDIETNILKDEINKLLEDEQ